ncbi:MAG: LemA family protein [Lachnospiraceae bacterium]|nr:LemA family protein [Lachnospiraceae bacterium]MBP3506342.1 LemA family protein [Lachnospiraceae bacterium]
MKDYFTLLIVIAVLGIVIQPILIANRLTRLRNKVRELEADIDVALEKRYDLLKKQYSIVKMYMSHESQTLIEMIKLRRGMSHEEQENAMKGMNDIASRINASFEAYPNLRSTENVLALQRSCDDVEEHLQAARRLYNAGATDYNNLCTTFPACLVATVTGHKQVEYFKADESKRKDFDAF